MEFSDKDWVSRWALYSPDKIALEEHETGKTISYSALNLLSNSFACDLDKTYKINKGDRVAVLYEFSIEYVALFCAAQKKGFIIVPLNYRLTQLEISEIIEDSKPGLILSDSKFSHLINDEYCHRVKKFSDLNDRLSNLGPVVVDIAENDPVFIIYTSGTTGKAKGVKYTHKMLLWNSINTTISLNLNSDSRTIVVMPPFHTGGWNVLLTPFLHHGGFVYVCKKFEPDIILNKLSSLKCSIFMGVPTMLAMMAKEISFDKSELECLDYIIVGGESMPISLIEKYAEKDIAIRQGYGMTEVGPNLTSLHQDDSITKKGSIGRPNFYVEHKIITEEGKTAEINEPGELWLKGPMVTPGYWNNDKATKEAFSQDGLWFKTGDIVIEDGDKYIYVVDRLKNMFISGGENVYPVEIEKVLRMLPEISECAVVGVKDEKWGEVGKGYVVLHENHSISEDALKSHCSTYLAKYKVPRYFKTVMQLPKTDTGKIDRKTLKKW